MILEKDLKSIDPVMAELVEREQVRQKRKLHLNAAISILPKSIAEIQGSVFNNVDAEGYIPDYIEKETLEELEDIDKQLELYTRYKDERCNKCCEFANIVEGLAQKRLARLFANELIDEKDIYVNVQVPSGALANYLVYQAFLKKGDTVLSLDSSVGGHTTHGNDEHISSSDYRVLHFHVDFKNKTINYEELKELLKKEHPKLLILGPTSFPLEIKWQKVRDLINSESPKTIFVADIAHIAGLIAGKAYNSPFGYADIITFVGYKTFGGPRTGVIFSTKKEYSERINKTIFPKILGSAIMSSITALAVSANIALTDEFCKLQQRIVENSKELCKELIKLNIPVVYENSDSHIVLIDVNNYGKSAKITDNFENSGIMINSCSVPYYNEIHDGIRLGTTWITELGATTKDMQAVAQIVKMVLDNEEPITTYKKVQKLLERLDEDGRF